MTARPRARSAERRAKIICTLGPATDEDRTLEALIAGGMDAARLNLSFGEHAEHIERIRRVRRASAKAGRPVAIIADIPGPKVRLGRLAGKRVTLEIDQRARFVRDTGSDGNASLLPVSAHFFAFCDELIRGDKILLSDGLVELAVETVRPDEVIATVVARGEVDERTGVHIPGLALRTGPIDGSDRPHLELAVNEELDYVALTYVRDSSDILGVQEELERLGRDIPIIAKIERPEAFQRLDGILDRADAVMIRRGDLGANIELTRVPLVQKEIVRLARTEGVPVIIATQMLGSMVSARRPTRAEASDASNAIVDGADGVLLSAETAVGRHPLLALEMMGRIVDETEREIAEHAPSIVFGGASTGFADTTAGIACRAAIQSEARVIACFTESGQTAGLLAKYRPQVPIIAFCHREETRRRLAVHWGVKSDELDPLDDAELMVREVDTHLRRLGKVVNGDRIVIVFGAPVGEMGHTNSVRLHQVGSMD